MLPDGSIRVANLWKRFRMDRRNFLLRDEISRLQARLRGDQSGWNWALKDLHFSVSPGEAVGLVGVNGSGKSTLLRIMARVMYPHAGAVEVAGRVGALIEVSSGIHPQLTGHENIYLYGSLLGLRRIEVTRRYDDIIQFAELEGAIHRQVKFYSSGMKMRLGFAIAAFLEPDVFLVDEVLAVGDAAFQQKCLDRMRTVLNQGTTLFFVSHDLAAVHATCSRGLWLEQGRLVSDGPIEDVLGQYRAAIEETAEMAPDYSGPVVLEKVEISGDRQEVPTSDSSLDVRMLFKSNVQGPARLYLGVSEGPATPIFSVRRDLQIDKGDSHIRCRVKRLPLPRGTFYLWAGLFSTVKGGRDLISWRPVSRFDVTGPSLDPPPRAVVRLAPVYVDVQWEQDTD